MVRITDDLGTDFRPRDPVRRVVSLVPSLTESLAASDARSALVGATKWCTEPADLDVDRVRGTKNPDLAAIRALGPDLVVANKEENREVDVRRLRGLGVPVWVTDIRTVDQALTSLRRLFADALQVAVPGWVAEAERVWAQPPIWETAPRVVVPIWRDPWMVVGSPTFTDDVLTRLGLHNVVESGPDRYPHTDAAAILGLAPDLVLFPDEPYEFTADDGPEALPGVPHALVDGRSLTWYGPSMCAARTIVETTVRTALHVRG